LNAVIDLTREAERLGSLEAVTPTATLELLSCMVTSQPVFEVRDGSLTRDTDMWGV